MRVNLAYHRRSEIAQGPAGVAIALSPNLRRDRVSYQGVLRQPLQFREAISALHDVVISDLKFKPRDKSAYKAWLEEQQQREAAIRRTAAQAKRAEIEARQGTPIRPGLEADYRRARTLYWKARLQYSNYLSRHDPELWRMLVPCDPVITVAPDVLFFECFSADESSYGCLTVGRDAFEREESVALGTTNVDYSWALYEHFQRLRSYRETRFSIDPSGFEVRTQEATDHREEKIDLPNTWLRGFLQLQAAMSLPMRRVPVSREALYNLLTWLKRHRAKRSPRALRFELNVGLSPALVVEPWEQRIELGPAKYDGPRAETIRIWGRDRLHVLARLLPLADSIEVGLLGTGLPSFWIVRMGEMRFVLGLSGWTVNDWTGASALDQLSPPGDVNELMLEEVASVFKNGPALTFAQICGQSPLPPPRVAAGLNRLALLGQVIHDLPANVYRWRQVLPAPLTNEQLGAESPETLEARRLLEGNHVTVLRNEPTPTGMRVLAGRLPGHSVELLIDGDGRMVRGQCNCSHHFKNGLRKGPCRHLQALRNKVLQSDRAKSVEGWFGDFWK